MIRNSEPPTQAESEPKPVVSAPATDGSASQPVTEAPQAPVTQAVQAVASVVSAIASSASPATVEIERKKVVAETSNSAPAADAIKPPVPQTGAYQDLQLKAEPAKATDSASPRNDAPRPTAAPQEPLLAEKNSAQALKSIALEFSPDGSRDIKVRLAERAGEVHVSLHSTDPSTNRSLRAGVTDLASVLAQAGYDARAWTSGRQQQENRQQPEDPAAPQRSTASGGAESFDGVLQQPGIAESI